MPFESIPRIMRGLYNCPEVLLRIALVVLLYVSNAVIRIHSGGVCRPGGAALAHPLSGRSRTLLPPAPGDPNPAKR